MPRINTRFLPTQYLAASLQMVPRRASSTVLLILSVGAGITPLYVMWFVLYFPDFFLLLNSSFYIHISIPPFITALKIKKKKLFCSHGNCASWQELLKLSVLLDLLDLLWLIMLEKHLKTNTKQNALMANGTVWEEKARSMHPSIACWSCAEYFHRGVSFSSWP